MRRMYSPLSALIALIAGVSLAWLVLDYRHRDDVAEPLAASPLSDSFDQVYAQQASLPAEKAQQLASWMQSNQWRSLDLTRRVQLMRGLADRSELGSVLSVRWTGFVTPPASESYKFTAYSNNHFPGKCRLWINGQLVIETVDTAKVANCEASYVSEPVALTQGESVALKLEFIYLPFARRASPADSISAETVTALLWESDTLSRTLVPSQALSPPGGFRAGSDSGLRGEYFSDSDFQQSAFSRLDSAVDLKSLVVVPSGTWSQHRVVLDDCFESLLAPTFLSDISSDLATDYWSNPDVGDVLEFATTEQRAEYTDWLIGHPAVLAADPGRFDRLFVRLATIPGDYRTRLLGAWSAGRSVQPITPGFYPVNYNSDNVDCEAIGRWLTGQYADDIKTLATADLKAPDGDCRVELLKVLTHGAVNGIHGGWLRLQVHQQMEGIPLNSDTRASWLLGLAAMEEIAGGYPVRPNLATPYLQEAMLVAQSSEMKFQVLSQFAPRLVSIGHFTDARDLLERNSGTFTLPDQRAAINQWQSDADQLEANWDSLVAAQRAAQQQAQKDNHVAMLRIRLERARQRGDRALAAKYQSRINQSSASN